MAVIDLFRGFSPDNPAQIAFLKSPAKYRLLSSGRGGGKSVVGCREAIRVARHFPESRTMVCRLKATELEKSTHVTMRRELRSIGFVKDEHYRYNDNKGTYYWANGSETVLSHLEDEEKFGSVELSAIFIDEASQVPDSVFQMLFPANLRWEVGPHRAWFCTNPGASGWLRDMVYGKAEGSGKETFHRRRDGSMERVVDTYEWFPVLPGWNKHNPGGQDYFDDIKRQGKRYGPHWLARYYDGSWDSFEGQRFPMFDREKHVLSSDWRPEPHHEVVEGWDFGHRTTHVVWLAYDPRGIEPVVVFDECVVHEVQRPEEVANPVHEIRKRYDIQDRVLAYGDPAGAGATQFSAVTPIGAYAALGIIIAPAKAAKSPTDRADRIASRLNQSKVQPDGSIWPGILFGPRTRSTISSVVDLRWDLTINTKGEDPRERFIDRNKHGFDALGYGEHGVPPPEAPSMSTPFRPGVNVDAKTAWSMPG